MKDSPSPPYFPFYPRDFIDGVIALSPAERGALISLLCHQWTARSIPADDIAALSRIMGTKSRAEATRVWNGIADKFERFDDGWRNARLERERTVVERHFAAQKANADKGGRPRGKPSEGNPRDIPRDIPSAAPWGIPNETQPKPEPKPVSGATDLSVSSIAAPPKFSSSVTSQPDGTPSDAQPAAGNAWTLWLQVKARTLDGAGPTMHKLFEAVYEAELRSGRLELHVPTAAQAIWLIEHHQRLLQDTLKAIGSDVMRVRAIAGRAKKAV